MKLFRVLTGTLLVTMLVVGLVPASPVHAQDGDCSKTPRTSFDFNQTVRVTDEYGDFALHLYAGANGSQVILGDLYPGDEATIQPVDPVCNGGQQWWFLLTEDGRAGWAVSAVDMDGAGLYEVVLEIVDGGGGNQPGAAPPGAPSDVIFEDDFSDPESGWEPGQGDNYRVGYENGQWHMELIQSWTSMWSRPITGETPLDDLTDFTAQVDIEPLDDVGAAGIAFRLDTGGDNYYQFLYRPSSGEYRLRVRRNGSWSTLIDWTYSAAIEGYPVTNTLKLTADGSTLALYANGELLAVHEDSSVRRGRLGFALWRSDQETRAGLVADYLFDNLLVTNPQPINQSAAPAASTCRASASRNVNVRSGPGETYTVIGSMRAGNPLSVTGYNGEWYAVRLNGREGWVAEWVVNLTGACGDLRYQQPGAAVLDEPDEPEPDQPPAQPQQPPPGAGLPPEAITYTVNGAAETTINAGECATVRWDVEGIDSVYYQGQGVTGQGQRQECPAQTTSYELRVVHADGTQTTHWVTINVAGGGEFVVRVWVNGVFVDASGDGVFGGADLCGEDGAFIEWEVVNGSSAEMGQQCNNGGICASRVPVPLVGDAYVPRQDNWFFIIWAESSDGRHGDAWAYLNWDCD